MPIFQSPEQKVVDAKTNLIEIEKLCDAAILRKVSLEVECKSLEARKADEESKVSGGKRFK